MRDYLLVGGVACATTFVLTFFVRRLAIRFGAVVKPDERRVHPKPMPTIGGAAMFLGFLAAMAVAARLEPFQDIFRGSSEPLGIVIAAAIMFGVGMADDLQEWSPPAKMAGQVLAATPLYLLAVVMYFFRIPFAGIVSIGPDLQPLLTVLWVIGMANAVNFIDGLDGLAAGIVAIAAGAFFLYATRLSDAALLEPSNAARLVAIITVGICLGFLPHNFPGRIMMGDAGALFLGLLMAASTLLVGGRTDDQFSGNTFFFFAPIFIPFFILGVPIIDTAFAIIRRSRRGMSAALGDRGHLHYRLLTLGHGQRRAVLILWAWTAVLSGLVLVPTYTGRGNAIIPLAVVGLCILLYTFFHPGVRRKASAVAAEPPLAVERGG